MISSASLWRHSPLAGQLVLMICGVLALYAMPPARGVMLLVPLTANARLLLVPTAIAHGARLVTKGPWAGSLLVQGESARLVGPLLQKGVIPLASGARGCGAPV